MKKSLKILGAVAVLAAMIPLSAYAASTSTLQGNADGKTGKEVTRSEHRFEGKGHFEGDFMRKQVSQEVLDLLKLDRKTFDEKLVKGETLAQIAQDQGVSRDDLKQTMTTSFNQELDKQKARFADNLDKLVDSKQQPHEFGNKGFRHKQDLSETAKLLGISNDDLKQALASGKSLADLATEKGIDVKQLIDLQVNNLMKRTNQDLKDGKITQEQADKHKAQFTNMATKMVNSKGFQGKSGDKFMIRKHKDGSETQPQSQLQPESQTQTQQ